MTRALSLLFVLIASSAFAQPPSTGAKTPVLVELFTSEGCSSCPPADAVLAQLAAGRGVGEAEVVPLSLHVDYWNRLGWTDPFSSAAFSERQATYGGPGGLYTPQMVVDGGDVFVGSDADHALRAVRLASRAAKPRLTLAVERGPGGLLVKVSAPPLPQSAGAPELLVAVTEDGLASDVARGENAGRRLPHVAVVRALTRVARASAGAPLAAERTLRLDPSWKKDALHVVAFLQEPGRRVVAAARAALPR
jgi:hypothetical protein